jgi:CHAD domain-containing protein
MASVQTMVALKVRAKSFDGVYRDRIRTLIDLAEGLPSRPSPSDIHDLRVTARRIQVMRRLLPGSQRRSQASKTFELSLKSVLKATSQLRDLDTLLDTLEHFRQTLPEEIFSRLENQRSDAAARAKTTSTVITNVAPPGLEVAEIRGKKLSRRLKKSVVKHGRKASEFLAIVVQDESKVAELHSLRKEVKKLRYLCELADVAPRELDVLTKWQESLGAVHDIDVALDFVRGSSLDFKGRAVSQLEHSRHASYLRFLGEYRKDSVRTIGKSKALSARPSLPVA